MKLPPEIFNKIKANTFEEFICTKSIIAGEDCYLVVPDHIGCKWNNENKIFRSSIWNSEGEPVSLSLKKFVNYGENPEVFLHPSKNTQFKAFSKKDGSTLIVSRYKGQTIFRTRGSFGFEAMDCAEEIEIFKTIHEKFLANFESIQTRDYSFIFEWTSPKNKIVVPYKEVKFFLLAVIDHADYSLLRQYVVDIIALSEGLIRPELIDFFTIDEAIEKTKNGNAADFGFNESLFEGFCIYFNDDQEILKVKNAHYLKLHAFKENINLKNVYELIKQNKFKTEEAALEFITKEYDWEMSQQALPWINQVFAAKNDADWVEQQAHFEIYGLPSARFYGIVELTRKEQAAHIMGLFRDREKHLNFSWAYFLVLDNRFNEIAREKLEKQILGL